MKRGKTAATAVFSFPAFTAARPSAFRASRTGRWASTGGRILMGLGSISRRSDAYLSCVGPLSQIVRRQGKRSSARVARPQSRHAVLFGSTLRATSIKWQRDSRLRRLGSGYKTRRSTCCRTGTIRRGFPVWTAVTPVRARCPSNARARSQWWAVFSLRGCQDQCGGIPSNFGIEAVGLLTQACCERTKPLAAWN